MYRSTQTVSAAQPLISQRDLQTLATTDMTHEQLQSWLRTRLNREPEPVDLYTLAKDLYHNGAFDKARMCLEVFVTAPGSSLPGHHLLGYCYLMLKQLDKAVASFQRCVNEGFDTDWQLLVEIQLEREALGVA